MAKRKRAIDRLPSDGIFLDDSVTAHDIAKAGKEDAKYTRDYQRKKLKELRGMSDADIKKKIKNSKTYRRDYMDNSPYSAEDYAQHIERAEIKQNIKLAKAELNRRKGKSLKSQGLVFG